MKVRELMAAPAESCRPQTNLAAAASQMWERDCGALPVVNGDGKVVGVITDRDICIALGTRNVPASALTVAEVVARAPVVCKTDETLQAAMEKMRKAKVNRLPVVDAKGKLAGMLTISELILRAQPCDGAKHPCVSHEDVVSTLAAIKLHTGARVKETAA